MATPGRDLPDEDIRWIERLFRYGFSWRKIMRTTGFSPTTIAKYRKQMLREARARRWERFKREGG